MRYRHAWPGLLLLASLATLLVSLVLWGDQFLSPDPSGGIRRLLQLWAASRPAEETLPPPSSRPAVSAAPGPETAAAAVSAAPAVDRIETETPAPPPLQPPPPAPIVTAPRKVETAAPPLVRYALDLGAFALDDEAERVETQLNQAGYSTVRFRQQAPARLFSVLVPLRDVAEGFEVLQRLKDEGLPQAMPLTGEGTPVVRAAQALPIKAAVELGERLRAARFEIRVSAEAARPGQISLRHGNFTSRQEAESAGRDISRLGVPNEIVDLR